MSDKLQPVRILSFLRRQESCKNHILNFYRMPAPRAGMVS